MPTVWMAAGLGIAYLLGSIPTGFWFAKAFRGLDIRQHGSGNIGASNVGRVLGKPWGIAVLILDVAKGTAAVLLGNRIHGADWYNILCALAAVSGHNWTIFLGFKGGKGVATSLGAVLGLVPVVAISSLALWAVVVKISGYISVGSISAAIGFCALLFILKASWEMKIFGLLLATMLILKHRSNIERLLKGTEPKIGQGSIGASHVVR